LYVLCKLNNVDDDNDDDDSVFLCFAEKSRDNTINGGMILLQI